MSTSRTAGSQFLCWLKVLRSVVHAVCANAVLIDHGDGTGELYCDYDDRVP